MTQNVIIDVFLCIIRDMFDKNIWTTEVYILERALLLRNAYINVFIKLVITKMSACLILDIFGLK